MNAMTQNRIQETLEDLDIDMPRRRTSRREPEPEPEQEPQRYKCEECGSNFSSERTYKQHMEYIHPKVDFEQFQKHFHADCRKRRKKSQHGSAKNVARLSVLKLVTIYISLTINKRKSRQACSASIARWALTRSASSLATKEPVWRRTKKRLERKLRKSGFRIIFGHEILIN